VNSRKHALKGLFFLKETIHDQGFKQIINGGKSPQDYSK